MPYQIADGHDNAAGLATIDPQPASEGLQYPKRRVAGDGTEYNDGSAFTIWRYRGVLSTTQYSALLTAFGLSSALTNEVTVRTLHGAARTTYSNYNATIVKPFNPRFERGFWRDIEFRVIKLEAL